MSRALTWILKKRSTHGQNTTAPEHTTSTRRTLRQKSETSASYLRRSAKKMGFRQFSWDTTPKTRKLP